MTKTNGEMFEITYYNKINTGLSFKGGGWGFPPATMNVVAGYLRRKRQEK